MDSKRFLIILGISLVFIILFCNDDVIEGATADENTGEDDENDDGSGSSDASSNTGSDASSNTGSDASTDEDESTTVTTPGMVFGTDCVSNCLEYAHECETKEEEVEENGVKLKKLTYGNIENCKNGSLPDKTCGDPKWGCKKCNSGFYLSQTDKLCKPQPNFGLSFSAASLCCVLLLPIIGYLGIKLYEWWDMRQNTNEAFAEYRGYSKGVQKYGSQGPGFYSI